MKMTAFLSLSALILCAGCANPDEPSSAQTTPAAPKNLPNQKVVQDQYSALVLSCNLDIRNKVTVSGVEQVETKTVTATSDLLRELGRDPAVVLQAQMSDLESNYEVSISNLDVSQVNSKPQTTLTLVYKGNLTKPLRPLTSTDTRTELDSSYWKVQLKDNVPVNLVDLKQGPTEDPSLGLSLKCQLNAVPKE